MNIKRGQPGFTLVEVMAALAILGIAMLGLTAGLIVASSTTGISAQRTLMLEFAQTRIERLVAETRTLIPTQYTTVATFQGGLCCGKMAVSGTGCGALFDPNAAPGNCGWQMDTIDGGAPGPGVGEDLMFGPLLIFNASTNSTDGFIAKTIAARTAAVAAGIDGALGCGDPSVRNSGTLCRELHIEPGVISGVPMLRAWVRVVNGAGSYLSNSVMLQEDIAQ